LASSARAISARSTATAGVPLPEPAVRLTAYRGGVLSGPQDLEVRHSWGRMAQSSHHGGDKKLAAKKQAKRVAAVDLFCGAGGLTHGLEQEGIRVVAGIDLDPACRFPYESNNSAVFLERNICEVSVKELETIFGDADTRILAGCAPCQPFSTYAQRYAQRQEDGKWGLMYHFARLARGAKPDIVTMENVPSVAKHRVFADFVAELRRLNYQVWSGVVDCCDYGVPQQRRRMVLLASKLGELEIIEATHARAKTVRNAIGRLAPIEAGSGSVRDRLHAAAGLSAKNIRRLQVSLPGGTWRDWPKHLVAECHKARTGKTYPGVYGRMEWDKPAPTMTTQCFGFGNGRFGHPEQDRAISLREAAILQGFPRGYSFVQEGQRINFSALGRLIGNAVPVDLGRAIGKSIRSHLANAA
jgi:DNA (cytosine-5)-methyltransferase 1